MAGGEGQEDTFSQLEKGLSGGFPGDPGAETPSSQCRGPGFDPWLGNYVPGAARECCSYDLAQPSK